MQEKNEIQKELESMNSKLGHISKAMPYSVPDNYYILIGNVQDGLHRVHFH